MVKPLSLYDILIIQHFYDPQLMFLIFPIPSEVMTQLS